MRRWLLALAVPFIALAFAARADVTDHYALVMVWMPGLCKLEPDRAECKELSLRRYDGLNLAFFALQSTRPNSAPNMFCNAMIGDEDQDRARQWCDMDKQRMTDGIADQLKTLMPVTQSCQDRGLWARYGTCTMYSVSDYYERAIKLSNAVAGTQMNVKIAAAVGETAKQSALVDAFKADFGEDNGNAVEFICRKIEGKSHLFQVRIMLTPRALTRGLQAEFLWKPSGSVRRKGCPENILVDAPPVATPAAAAAPAAPPPPPPGEPPVPDSAPVAPVDMAPLEPLGPVRR